jgi:hypothetical protein
VGGVVLLLVVLSPLLSSEPTIRATFATRGAFAGTSRMRPGISSPSGSVFYSGPFRLSLAYSANWSKVGRQTF